MFKAFSHSLNLIDYTFMVVVPLSKGLIPYQSDSNRASIATKTPTTVNRTLSV